MGGSCAACTRVCVVWNRVLVDTIQESNLCDAPFFLPPFLSAVPGSPAGRTQVQTVRGGHTAGMGEMGGMRFSRGCEMGCLGHRFPALLATVTYGAARGAGGAGGEEARAWEWAWLPVAAAAI